MGWAKLKINQVWYWLGVIPTIYTLFIWPHVSSLFSTACLHMERKVVWITHVMSQETFVWLHSLRSRYQVSDKSSFPTLLSQTESAFRIGSRAWSYTHWEKYPWSSEKSTHTPAPSPRGCAFVVNTFGVNGCDYGVTGGKLVLDLNPDAKTKANKP